MSTLKKFLLRVRSNLDDMNVRQWPEPLLVDAINEGKNQLTAVIRRADQDFFFTTGTGSVNVVTAGNPSVITLPADFLEFKDLALTSAGFENVMFTHLDRSDERFKMMLNTQPDVSEGVEVYFDIVANAAIHLAPGFKTAYNYRLGYIKQVADLVLLTDTLADVPIEHHDYVVAYAVAEALRSKKGGDPRLASWEAKVAAIEKRSWFSGVNRRFFGEVKFVTGYSGMEE